MARPRPAPGTSCRRALIDAKEWLEHPVEQILRNAGAAVEDPENRFFAGTGQRNTCALTMRRGIHHQVSQRTLEGKRGTLDQDRDDCTMLDRQIRLPDLCGYRAQNHVKRHLFLRRRADFLAHQPDGAVSDMIEFIEILEPGLPVIAIDDEFGAEAAYGSSACACHGPRPQSSACGWTRLR